MINDETYTSDGLMQMITCLVSSPEERSIFILR